MSGAIFNNKTQTADINTNEKELIEKILTLKKEKNATILAHNYQVPAIQDLADFVGDSLDLCIKSTKLKDSDVIVFCGVDFMAETAAILNPDKTIIIPEAESRCPMAAMLRPEDVTECKKRHPDAPVVLYVNTTAACKAEADIMCTSANAIEVVNSFSQKTVLFGPDANMAYWIRKNTDKKIITIPEKGYCPVHEQLITVDDVLNLKKEHPGALVLAHSECTPKVQDIADYIASTNQMVKIAKNQDGMEFIIATEEGMCHRLEKEVPDKKFYPIKKAVCANMKKHTLKKIYESLNEMKPIISIDNEIAKKAKRAIDKMLELSL
jgi:quinolinate synthase